MGTLRALTLSASGRRRRGFAPPVRLLALVAPALLAGCTDAKFLRRNAPAARDPAAAATPAPDLRYRVGCPDVLNLSFADRPDWDALAAVDLDGRLPLDGPGRPRVEGLTLDEVRDELARLADVPPDRVGVALAAARSGHVFVTGPVRGRTRVVPYQGPEPVVEFLQRVGGLPPGSKLNQVYVVRPQAAAGARPEVFRVDLPAVLLDRDPATNVALRPSDEVYVGETRGSSFSRVLPPWLGAAYRRAAGLLPDFRWPFVGPVERGP